MEFDGYMLYLQKYNGYWVGEPYDTLEEIQYDLDNGVYDDEYAWYLVVGKSHINGDQALAQGKLHPKNKRR